jgi:UDP-glucose 4-epimerase
VLSERNILVTGGAGFIGSHLASKLCDSGHEVYVLEHPENDLSRIADLALGDRVVRADLADAKMTAEAIRAAKPGIVFHLAACSDRRRELSLDEAVHVYLANAVGSFNLMTCLQETSVASVIVLGSCEEYGRVAIPFAETTREEPISHYGISKLSVTNLCRFLYRSRGFPVTVLRPTVVYGPGQNGAGVVSQAIRACITGRQLKMSSGDQTRDFVFVDDIVRACILAATTKRCQGSVINIGSGESLSVAALARQLAQEVGVGFDEVFKLGALPYRGNGAEIMEYACSIELAKDLLGWRPLIPLNVGLLRVLGLDREAIAHDSSAHLEGGQGT